MKIGDFRHFFVQKVSENFPGDPPKTPGKTGGKPGGFFPVFLWDPLCGGGYPRGKSGGKSGENPPGNFPKSGKSGKFREILVEKVTFLTILTHF